MSIEHILINSKNSGKKSKFKRWICIITKSKLRVWKLIRNGHNIFKFYFSLLIFSKVIKTSSLNWKKWRNIFDRYTLKIKNKSPTKSHHFDDIFRWEDKFIFLPFCIARLCRPLWPIVMSGLFDLLNFFLYFMPDHLLLLFIKIVVSTLFLFLWLDSNHLSLHLLNFLPSNIFLALIIDSNPLKLSYFLLGFIHYDFWRAELIYFPVMDWIIQNIVYFTPFSTLTTINND